MSENALVISPDTRIRSIEDTALQCLKTSGFVILKQTAVPGENDDLEKRIIAVSVLLGRLFASSVAYVTLRKKDDDKYLAKHTEGIYARHGITLYFALGCVQPAEEGGHTRVFSAHRAAVLLRNEHPDIASVEIEYSSAVYPEERAVYSLCTGETFRFRGRTPQNRILNLPANYSEDTFYRVVEDVLERSLVLDHVWERGDIVFVNNMSTLHDKTPHKGMRIMVRVRFDDPLNVSVRY